MSSINVNCMLLQFLVGTSAIIFYIYIPPRSLLFRRVGLSSIFYSRPKHRKSIAAQTTSFQKPLKPFSLSECKHHPDPVSIHNRYISRHSYDVFDSLKVGIQLCPLHYNLLISIFPYLHRLLCTRQ